jgi:hypothetical protein
MEWFFGAVMGDSAAVQDQWFDRSVLETVDVSAKPGTITTSIAPNVHHVDLWQETG